MVMENRHIGAGQFKARCLALLDEVASTGKSIVVTKRGKPVARVVPITRLKPGSLKGTVRFEGDIISPIGVKWDAES